MSFQTHDNEHCDGQWYSRCRRSGIFPSRDGPPLTLEADDSCSTLAAMPVQCATRDWMYETDRCCSKEQTELHIVCGFTPGAPRTGLARRLSYQDLPSGDINQHLSCCRHAQLRHTFSAVPTVLRKRKHPMGTCDDVMDRMLLDHHITPTAIDSVDCSRCTPHSGLD